MKTAKNKFARVFYIVFFSVLIIFSLLTIRMFLQTRNENLSMGFRATIIRLKYQHGSTFNAFVDLSNGKNYLFTLPSREIIVGDSIIKIQNEDFFRVKKESGQEIGKISLNGNLYRE